MNIHPGKLFLIACLTMILAQATHETGHLLFCQALRCEPTWGFIGLVQRWEEGPPLHPENWLETRGNQGDPGWYRLRSFPENGLNRALLSAAGPLAGALGAILGLWLARRQKSTTWRMYCLVGSLTATLYYLRNPVRPYGDEYDLAIQSGIPQVAIVLFFVLIFLFCLSRALASLPGHRVRLTWFGLALAGSISVGLPMNLLDGWIRMMVNLENPFFLPVFGYALPVFLTYLLAGLGLFLLTRKPA